MCRRRVEFKTDIGEFWICLLSNQPLIDLFNVWKIMMSSSLKELFLKEIRLVRQAKSGDTKAFVQLYDLCVERVYRYIHFLVPNDRVAEGLTFQVFFKAWGQLVRFRTLGPSFILWLYSIAQDQLILYDRTLEKAVTRDSDFMLTVRGGYFWREFQTIRDGLRFLTAEQRQILILRFVVGMPDKDIARVMTRLEGDIRVLQMRALQALAESLQEKELGINTKGFQRILEECLIRLSSGSSTLDECLARYLEYDTQIRPLLETALLLNLGRNVKPSSTFIAYTRDALIQYMRSHPYRPPIVTPMFRRTALTFTILIAAFLVAGTAQAQSALPGDTFYGWKRTSERLWRVISPDPIAADIVLANRRLDEWIAVADDPIRSADARDSYLEVISRLQPTGDDVENTINRIVPALQSQQKILNEAGLASDELNDYLVEASSVLPVATLTQTMPTASRVPPTATNIPPTVTNIPPTATQVPPTATQIPPTVTATQVPPTETQIPMSPTDAPTEIVPTATDVPTEIVPIPTDIPTEVPTETAPADFPP